MGLGAGHGRVQQLASSMSSRGCEFLDPANGERAAFNEHRSARCSRQRPVFAKPNATRGNIIRDHADDDVRARRSLAWRSRNSRARTAEGGRFVSISVIDG